METPPSTDRTIAELIYYLYQYAMPLFFVFFFLSFFSFILVVQCSGIFFV